MMRPNFDELVRAAGGDGASVVTQRPSDRCADQGESEPVADVQEMMGAWTIERQRAVEAELVLRKTLRLLKRQLRSRRVLPDSERREVQDLVRIIRFRLEQQC